MGIQIFHEIISSPHFSHLIGSRPNLLLIFARHPNFCKPQSWVDFSLIQPKTGVDLTPDEQEHLLNLIKKCNLSARKVARAHVLLHADEGATDGEIAESLHLGVSTVRRTRQRFVEEGLTAALSEQPRLGKAPTLTGKQQAYLIALACGTPPEGRRRWTMQLLADRLIELKLVEKVSPDTVQRALKKMTPNPGSAKSGVFPA